VSAGDLDITKKVRLVEWLKAELLNGVAALQRALFRKEEDAMLESLADTIITAYLLARRLGFSFARLEGKIAGKLRVNIEEQHQVEKWYGDLSALLEHLEQAGDRH
jgi:hypothetical protein